MSLLVDLAVKGGWADCLEEASETLGSYEDWQRISVIDGFARSGFFGAARKEARKLESSAARADAFYRIWQITQSGADVDEMRAAGIEEKLFENRQAHARLRAYQAGGLDVDLTAAREAAKSVYDPEKKAGIWAEIVEAAQGPDDLKEALSALDGTPEYERRGARVRLIGSLARTHNYRLAFAQAKFLAGEQCSAERGWAFTAIARAFVAERRLAPALRTMERVDSPFWRCRGLLDLYDDLCAMKVS